MVELVDTVVLGTTVVIRTGSSPVKDTISREWEHSNATPSNLLLKPGESPGKAFMGKLVDPQGLSPCKQ